MTIHVLPLEPDHLGFLYRVRLEQADHLRTPWVQGGADYAAWIQSLPGDRTQHFVALYTDTLRSVMEHRARGQPLNPVAIGGFTSIDWVSRHAEVSFLCDQDRFAIEALQTLVGYGFDRLGFHRLWAEAYTDKRVELFQMAGFKKEGMRREALYRAGWRDTVSLSVLAQEWPPA